jgi:hypothetical protein
VRQDEAHRPDDVRCRREQHLALDQRLTHQAELVVLEIAQAAVDQLAAARAGTLAEIALLAQEHFQAAAGRVARDPGTVHAAADHQDVDPRLGHAESARAHGVAAVSFGRGP